MGMTISKAMEILTAENFNGYSMSEIIEARNMTLDIMKKYQKIQAEKVAMLDEIKDKIEDCLYKISGGSTYLDIEREFVRDEIFKIIDGYAESEDLND